jgi:hypothetical protein
LYFPAYHGVTVDPILAIAPGHAHRGRGDFYTLKSAITFDDRSIVDNYVIDFEVHALNLCFDVKFTLHNVGRINMPELGGFSTVPPGPHIHELSIKVLTSQHIMVKKFNMTLEYPLDPDQAGNRRELRKDSSRNLCTKAPFDPPTQASHVIRPKKPSFQLTENGYQVHDTCYMVTMANVFKIGLFQNHLLLFDKGTGASRFQITMTTSTEVVKALGNLAPSIYVRVGNKNRTEITKFGTDQATIGETRSYEALVIGYPTPEVTIYTPRSGKDNPLPMYTNGRSYHRGFPLLYDVVKGDSGIYRIKAKNDAGSMQFFFNVNVK